MNNAQQMIQRHAYIRAGIQRDASQGRQTPSHILQEFQTIEAKAQAMFSPQELQQAQAASRSMEAQYLQQHNVKMAYSDANQKGYYAEQLSRDLTGMTPDQLEYAKRGMPIPVKGKGHTPYKENLRQMLINQGLGDIPYEKFVKVADRVEEMKGSGKSPTGYLKKSFGAKAAAAESLIGAFHMSGIGVELGISGEAEKDHFVQPTDELQRRTNIADAWARKALTEKADRSAIAQDIDPAYVDPENDTVQGDIARTMMAMEREEQANDRANYTVPSYNIEQSEDELDAVSGF